jgi:hypothetical protein
MCTKILPFQALASIVLRKLAVHMPNSSGRYYPKVSSKQRANMWRSAGNFDRNLNTRLGCPFEIPQVEEYPCSQGRFIKNVVDPFF